MKLADLDLLSVGVSLQLAGAIYTGYEKTLVCLLPDEEFGDPELLDMDLDDWKKFLHQADMVEVEARVKDPDGKVVKALLRKCQRQISQHVSWNVFRRDGFRCRYCGAGDVPLTVDHLLLWKDGGPSIEENLVSSCRKCNKTRGDTPYDEWMQHPYYRKVSKNLDRDTYGANLLLMDSIQEIECRPHKMSR